jgi:UDP-N-acetylmuramoyl-tripeptide--D-alanyl-D-alanine ligase
MRMERGRKNGIEIINDAYNSNPLSLRCAIETLSGMEAEGKKILISGDMMELGDRERHFHNLAGRMVAGSSIDVLIAVGRLSRHTASGALCSGMKRPGVWHCLNAEEAANLARRVARAGDVVLVKGSRAMCMERIIERI